MARSDFKDVNEYISSFPKETQVILKKLRQFIKDLIPGATEVISYQIPTFKLNKKYVIYFAGFKTHVSLYPVHPDEYPFSSELKEYASGKATVQFPLDKPLPFELIKKIVEFKVKAVLD